MNASKNVRVEWDLRLLVFNYAAIQSYIHAIL